MRLSKEQLIIIVFTIITTMLLVFAAVILFQTFFPPDAQIMIPTPYVEIIPAPTQTLFSDNQKPETTITLEQNEIVDGISVGAFVQVIGTGNTGLRLREKPGLQMNVIFIAGESEVFEVLDGPEQMDEKTWWYLSAPYDPGRAGWAVIDYLVLLETPQP